MMSDLDVCGCPLPLTISEDNFALCTKPPKHCGKHGCMIDYEWPDKVILASSDPEDHRKIQEDPPILLTFKIRAPKGKKQRPFIKAAYGT